VKCPQYSIRLEALSYLCDYLSGRVQRWQVVKVIWHKMHRHHRWIVQCYSTDNSNVSSHEDTLAPPGKYNWICAFFGPLESTTQVANQLDKPFLHSSLQKVPTIYNGRPCPPELPLQMGDLDPHVTHDALGHASPQPKQHLDVCTDDRGISLYFTMVCLFPP